MPLRHLVMLAENHDPLKFKTDGSLVSEKMDGFRCLWLPWTRGIPWENLFWSNRARDDRQYVATGLWTRRGKPIMAPAYFLDQFPKDMPLDGELHMGRGEFQKTASVVRKLEPDLNEWMGVRFSAFDIPSYSEFFKPGQIREGGKAEDPAYQVTFKIGCGKQFNLMDDPYWAPKRFSDVLWFFKNKVTWESQTDFATQLRLDHTREAAENTVADMLVNICKDGAEGLMLRQPHSIWEPVRSVDLVKVKPLDDAEGTIIGYTRGKGHLSDKIGAFRVAWGGVEFDLSGFMESERFVDAHGQEVFDYLQPGEYTEKCLSDQFPIGSVVTFRYSDVTKDGKPKFARFWRKHVG